MSIDIEIITCPQWGARKPKQGITTIGPSEAFVMHHTASHHRELDHNARTITVEEAKQYARGIQVLHMSPGGLGVPEGGIDSGHNFLIMRNGLILQGRWLTVSAIEAGHMVQSAHAGDAKGNRQIGIEHEHNGLEPMTKEQFQSSARLMAWVCEQYGRHSPMPIHPHSLYTRTLCPSNLRSEIPHLYTAVRELLKGV